MNQIPGDKGYTILGIDIGGTKCAVSLAQTAAGLPQIAAKKQFPTPKSASAALEKLVRGSAELLQAEGIAVENVDVIGISCGGPLDSRAGLILSPPNLPGWDRVDVISPFQNGLRDNVPVFLENDANACALAEWQWGAGRGCQNMIFLTFGTGMGAGLILNGQLYAGTNGMAGEVGHMRLADSGPWGYGKNGSFEGFCSGGGIAQLAQLRLAQLRTEGGTSTLEAGGEPSAKAVADAALAGDSLAANVFREVGERLGQGLAVLVDILNPERIVIGSIYSRQQGLLAEPAAEMLRREALALSLEVCQVVPAGLGEAVGDYASAAVAWYGLRGKV